MTYQTYQRMLPKAAVYQQGVVLFIALVALLVLSLAAVGLIRSVDTNTLIAGNLAFKQSASFSADHGVETAISWLKNNPAALNANSNPNGYFAGLDTGPGNNKALFAAEATWANAARAVGDGISGGVETSTANNIRYIVQRMCKSAGTPSVANPCLYGSSTSKGGDKSRAGIRGGIDGAGIKSPIYRVTVRVVGPKNTVGYTQAFVF